MKVLLVCSAGMSTSILIKNMLKFVDAEDVVAAYPVSQLAERVDEFDVVLVGPQIRYQFKQIEGICKEHGKNVAVIEMRTYGTMDGALALKQARTLL